MPPWKPGAPPVSMPVAGKGKHLHRAGSVCARTACLGGAVSRRAAAGEEGGPVFAFSDMMVIVVWKQKIEDVDPGGRKTNADLSAPVSMPHPQCSRLSHMEPVLDGA